MNAATRGKKSGGGTGKVVLTESCSVAIILVSQLYKAAAVDSVEAVVAVAVRVAAGAAHAEESLVLKVAPQLN